MAADAPSALLPQETDEAPAGRLYAPREQPEWPPREEPEQPPRAQPGPLIDGSSEPDKQPPSPRQRWPRWSLFALLPLALILGGYWYVTGGRVMSTDNAYVEADKVGITTDIAGIVKESDVKNNQHLDPGQVPFPFDDLPFRLALERTAAQVGN